ncbi:M20/M25/M40 family metallo-hydrolase [Saccharopolyspora sp. WRP15-2]|uniref:M20/M25/M40 family metallo-hydrolase n=1 Tax=Saccharopolyspora oryzae TaxID=2997343 RepID=A0ABT4VAR2_9PSEU|nr:M20/M25/M40 family metallo-hydrolase [Saccharopolyspora oryzae]MDA3631045.1 M20/M25/M40 family metallo-hydrolase [Saccharopolyspora oryzae]
MSLIESEAVDAGRMRDRLHRYVRLETPSGDADALDALLDLLRRRYDELGARTELHASATGANLVAHFPGTGDGQDQRPVLCLGHHDTVWPTGTLDGSVPWLEQDGRIHGPGVYDMKGGLVVFETAVELLAQHGIPHRPITMVLVADEEVGSPSARGLVAEHCRDAVAALGFEPPHPDGAVKTARWGSTRARIRVTGRESHAALAPEDGASAIEELVDQLLVVRQIAADHPDMLCNVGTIAGGGRTNVVPGEASCEIGMRFTDTATERSALAALHELAPVRPGTTVTAEILTSRPVWTEPDTGELTDALARAGRAVGQEVSGRPAAGAADTNLTGSLGVPSLDGLGPVGRGAHAPDEQIIAATLPERAILTASLLAHL